MPKNAQITTQFHSCISHASKVVLKILQARLQQYITVNFQMLKLYLEKAEEPEIKLPTSVVSWKKSKRVPEKHLLLLSWLHQSLWLCGSKKLWKILQEMGIPDHLTCLLRNLYAGQGATVRMGHGTVDWFQIGKGVCQSCILSPCFFNFYTKYIVWNARLDKAQSGIKIVGRNINNLRYADDTTFMVENEEELKSLLMKVKWESEKAGLKLNIQETKKMASSPIISWQIDGEKMETMRDFILGGRKVTADGDCSH